MVLSSSACDLMLSRDWASARPTSNAIRGTSNVIFDRARISFISRVYVTRARNVPCVVAEEVEPASVKHLMTLEAGLSDSSEYGQTGPVRSGRLRRGSRLRSLWRRLRDVDDQVPRLWNLGGSVHDLSYERLQSG